MFDYDDSRLPQDLGDLQDYFQRLLQEVPPHITMVILLDSIEALKGDPAAQAMQWFPNRLPENIKLILSTVDTDHGKKVMKDLQNHRISKRQFVEVHPLDHETCKTVLKSWLKTGRRQLTHPQWRAVDEVIQDGCTPLYVQLLREHVVTWSSGSHDSQLPKDIESFFSLVIDNLQEKHGKNLVTTVLGLLVLSKHGVTEIEIEDMLSIDDVVSTSLIHSSVAFFLRQILDLPGIVL